MLRNKVAIVSTFGGSNESSNVARLSFVISEGSRGSAAAINGLKLGSFGFFS